MWVVKISNVLGYESQSQKTQGQLLGYFLYLRTLRREMAFVNEKLIGKFVKKLLSSCSVSREAPFGNKIHWFKFLGSCSFQIYMVMQDYSQNPRSKSWRNYFLPAPSVGRRPLEMKCIDSSSLGHAVSKYIWLCRSIPKTQGAICEETTFFLLLQ